MRLVDADRLKTTQEIQMADFNSIEGVRAWIDRQPTIEAEPVVHGEWIKVADLCMVEVWKCSACGRERPRLPTAYCCDCGAKMNGGSDE